MNNELNDDKIDLIFTNFEGDIKKEKVENDTLTREELDDFMTRLSDYLFSDKPEPFLTAEELGLNHSSNGGFFEFIHNQRPDEYLSAEEMDKLLTDYNKQENE